MFDIKTARRSPLRHTDRLGSRRHEQLRPATEDERFEIYTDLATLLAAGDDNVRDVS